MRKLAATPEEQKQWAAQWRYAGEALAEMKTRELRALTEEQAAIDSEMLQNLLDLTHPLPRDEFVTCTSGLVEQQRLFSLLRKQG